MTIGIDIRVLGNPIKSGVEEYAEKLIPSLIKEGHGINFKLFYSSKRSPLPDFVWLKKPNVKLYKFRYPNNLLFTSSRFFNRPFIDKMVGGADVFFCPHFFISSLSPSCKRVTTFHDLSYLHFPEHLTLRKKIWHNLQMMPEWQARFSDKIIAVSESTKNDLTNLYKIDPSRIEVVHSGISHSAVKADKNLAENFKKSKGLPRRFILFLGKLEPRKNITCIIKTFNNLKTNPENRDLGLVIAGAKGWRYGDIMKEVEKSYHKDQIIFTGQINDKEKFLYYSAADVFVYPSLFEGFGFPPLEAMCCGTPVISSRNSSIPEVLEDSAILIDPYDVMEIEMWITKLLENKDLGSALIKKGFKQSSKFSWHDAAIRTLNVLTKI